MKQLFSISIPLAAMLLPGHALAYIGPGAGLSAIGAALALVGAIVLGIVGFLWYPIKRLMKRRKSASSEPEQQTATVASEAVEKTSIGDSETANDETSRRD